MLFKDIFLVCFFVIPTSAQHHEATSYAPSNQGEHSHSKYAHKNSVLFATASQYYSSVPITTYIQKYSTTPLVTKLPIVTHKNDEEEHDVPAHYEFQYAVEDKHSGDIKSQHEVRDGDVVKGEYYLQEADGTVRTVKYTANKHSGFNAIVERTGHSAHPQVVPVKAVQQAAVVLQTVGDAHRFAPYH